MSDRPVSTVPAVLAPFQTVFRDLRVLFSVPLALVGGVFGMLALTGAVVGFFLWSPNLALADDDADEDDDEYLEFEPGALVRIGEERPEAELPEKIITEDAKVAQEAVEETVTKDETPPLELPEEKKKKDVKKVKKSAVDDDRDVKESDHTSKKNTPYDDLPTVDTLPGDPFGDPDGWSDLRKDGDPWATEVMKRLNNLQIGCYAGKCPSGTYKFELKICKDGSVENVYQKQSSGSGDLDSKIKAELGRMEIPKPPPHIAKHMKSPCVKLQYRFVWTSGRVK
jgi:outer membrane biosynthesis protein TonB